MKKSPERVLQNTMLCPIKVNSNAIELTLHTLLVIAS